MSFADSAIAVIRDRLAYALGFSHQGARDLYRQFGWDRVLQKEQLFAMYGRNPIANRIIRLYPQSTWREKPIIRDEAGDSPEKDKPGYSPFVEAVDALFEEHRIFHFLERGDRVASIGNFGCLLFGFADGALMDKPLTRGRHKLLYIQPYSNLNVTVGKIDEDPKSPRFGRPELYTLQTGGSPYTNAQGQSTPRRSIVAHWTRVIHLAELCDEDDVYGIPRLYPVYNYLFDLDKLLGASTETFWLNARAGISIEADKDANLDAADIERAREQAESYEHQLRRIMALRGMKVNVLEASTEDPSPTVNGLMDAISGGSGIPKRILLGSERGELASSQDENNWAQRTDERRQSFAMPAVLTPVVNLLIFTGNLPEPKGQWWVEWAGKALTPEQQANVGSSMANTLKNYLTAPGADIIVPPSEFRVRFLGLPPQSDVEPGEVDEAFEDEKEQLKAEALAAEEAKAAAKGEGGEGDEGEGGKDGPPRTNQELLLIANTKVAPLYVYRPVLNAGAIIKWAKDQGFPSTLAADDLHVTICYSKASVDWLQMGSDDFNDQNGGIRVKPGGPRLVEKYGNAFVLSFADSALSWRHEDLKRKGASSDYVPYCPHVTVTYNGDDLDLAEIEPYTGEILLGPERFEEITPGWTATEIET